MSQGARDWRSGRPLAELDEPLVIHQVFAASWLTPRGITPDSLLNFVALPESTHAALASIVEPTALLEHADVEPDAVATHILDLDALRAGDWHAFATHRTSELFRRLQSVAETMPASLTTTTTSAKGSRRRRAQIGGVPVAAEAYRRSVGPEWFGVESAQAQLVGVSRALPAEGCAYGLAMHSHQAVPL